MKISYQTLLFDFEKILKSISGDLIILTSSDEEAYSYFNILKFFSSNNILLFPSFDSMPYDRVSPSSKILSQRANILSNLANKNTKSVLITNITNLLFKYSNLEDYKDSILELKTGKKLSRTDLEKYLLKYGYNRQHTAIESGDFSSRGDILDVVLFDGSGYRVIFEWDKIELIKKFDSETQISVDKIDSVLLSPSSELLLNEESISNFRNEFLQNFGIAASKEPYFEKTIEYIKVSGIENIAPIFYSKTLNLLEYLNSPVVYTTHLVENALSEYVEQIDDFYQSRIASDSFYPAFKPDDLYFSSTSFENKIRESTKISKSFENSDCKIAPNFFQQSQLEQNNLTSIQQFSSFVREKLFKKICIFYSSLSNLERIKQLFKLEEISFVEVNSFQELKNGIIGLYSLDFDRGFYSKDFAFFTDKEILGDKKTSSTSSKKKLKNILREIENFSEGDLIVHIDHGVGIYDGIEQIEVDRIRHDCLRLIYARGDKLFIPVENIDAIKKYGDEIVELDYLGSASWQRRKAKFKERIGELAKILIDTAAKRALYKVEHTEYSLDSYNKFCDKFPYSETDDQENAISEIINDLSEEKLMDRLICGDVGFGKTEIAMRAAFLVAENKQVAVIVPTTILARQHYNNFIERFKGFSYKIKQLSRFVSNSDAIKVKEELKSGNVNIVIGTHSILSDDVKFKDLGLIIIDEEQHFGVAQKEKLKQLAAGIHCLTLTATPIPRTLQMSLIGVKDLSIIATPPVDRLSVKTSVIKFDDVIIREAILREKFRGGKSFFVCPRISDINEISDKLSKLIPEVKIKVAHGRLAVNTIDNVMTEFYEGKFDVLISTAIVESGLDIPSANTMIVYKAEMFGLSQLYQLRGRVGRSKVRGYAYLVTDTKKLPTKSAIKRLEILESIDSLGAGFSIASHDMDIRGFGNLVGDEQSGHIKEVGVELYQELLEEAINNNKSKDDIETSSIMPDVKVNLPIYIPEDYISDTSLRLSIYRRAGDLRSNEELEDFKDELVDRFGKIPETVQNLLGVISIKIQCKKLNIKALEIGNSGVNLIFYDNSDNNKIMNFIANNKANTKVKPGNKISYIKKLSQNQYVESVKNILIEFEGS
jgi:transcription-repair coupling factor (superfamily II helicase)